MTNVSLHLATQRVMYWPKTGWSAVLLGLAIYALLWVLDIPYRKIYLPNNADIPALADGLLLAPGARWEQWFTRGYSDFWLPYPEWPGSVTEFTRPAFQFVIYLAHFAFGRDWASYVVISYLAIAGVAAMAFYIARTVLKVRVGPSLLAAILVVLSPPVLEVWLRGLAFSIDPLATILVVGAFLAVMDRRDFSCLVLLFLGLLMKENAVWAPAAAAITVMLRPKLDEPVQARVLSAAIMLLPIATWLGLRFAFFGGIGGTYVTAGYTPLANFLHLLFHKLTHMHHLFVARYPHPIFVMTHPDLISKLRWVLRGVVIGTGLIIYALVFLWALNILPKVVNRIRLAAHERSWPVADPPFLVGLWAAFAIAFHFALALPDERYATSLVVFAWPALVAEVEARRKTIIWIGLAFCSVASLALASTWLAGKVVPREWRVMNQALHQVPSGTRQIYILPGTRASLPVASPRYVRLILGLPAEIIRVVDIDWHCETSSGDVAAFDHSVTDGIVSLSVKLPACANFALLSAQFADNELAAGRLYRNKTLTYEFPEVTSITSGSSGNHNLGRRLIVLVRPETPARFIIEHGAPYGITWFDIP